MGKIKEFEINNDYNSGCIIGEMASGQCFKTFTLALVNAFMGKKGGGVWGTDDGPAYIDKNGKIAIKENFYDNK